MVPQAVRRTLIRAPFQGARFCFRAVPANAPPLNRLEDARGAFQSERSKRQVATVAQDTRAFPEEFS
jgi:hypothetical protein